MILSLAVFIAFMPIILVIAMLLKAKAAARKREWHAEHINVSYRKPSPSESRNSEFIRAVNKYVINKIEEVTDIKVLGNYLRNVVIVYVEKKKGRQRLTLFKRHTDKGWEFTEKTSTDEKSSPKDDGPKGEDFNEDDDEMVRVLLS